MPRSQHILGHPTLQPGLASLFVKKFGMASPFVKKFGMASSFVKNPKIFALYFAEFCPLSMEHAVYEDENGERLNELTEVMKEADGNTLSLCGTP